MSTKIATLEILNANDNPTAVGGVMLGIDGLGNQLWKLGEKVANRWHDSKSYAVRWSDEIEGWGYASEDALDA